MKKYLISLAKDTHRRELFFSQPDSKDFQLFDAINTMQAEPKSLAEKFDVNKFEMRYGRKVTKGEIGCTLSHLGVYQLIAQDDSIKEDEYCLICEDDALFNQDFQNNLDKLIEQGINADIILVGQSKIADFKDNELEINYPTTIKTLCKKIKGTNFYYGYPYKNYFAGTVAYLIKKSAVIKILSQCEKENIPYWLADDYILFGNQFKIDTLVIRPLMAIENPSLASNLEDLRGSVKHNFWKKLLKYPLKKLLAIKRNLK